MPPSPILAVKDLHAHYGRAHILQGVSLEASAGEVVALLGRNGAGKSTTLKAIMGLLPPSKGEVAFAGARVERLDILGGQRTFGLEAVSRRYPVAPASFEESRDFDAR